MVVEADFEFGERACVDKTQTITLVLAYGLAVNRTKDRRINRLTGSKLSTLYVLLS